MMTSSGMTTTPTIIAIFGLLIWFPSVVHTFHLELNPENIEIFYTENVELICNSKGEDISDIVKVTRIRIAKEGEDGTWQNFGKIIDKNTKILSDPDASGAGEIGDPKTANLKIIWALATEEIMGKYRCDVVGLNQHGEFVFDNSEPFTVKDSEESITDVLEVLDKQRSQAQERFDKIKIQLLEVSQRKAKIETSKIERHFSDNDARFDKIESKMDELLALYKVDMAPPCPLMEPFVSDFDADIWPYGFYGLLMPQTGCPAGTDHEWFTGTRQHLTNGESQIPSNTHLSTPIISGNFFNQRFCVINNTRSERAWPKGSYCINRKKEYCPGGFIPGFMRYDDKRSGSVRSGVLPDGYYSTYTRIYYCCRHDAPTTTPMVLPPFKPFYLYRYLGQCQKIRDMTVKEEWFLIDTAGDDHGDSYNSKIHPDGELNPVRLELCYYEKESMSTKHIGIYQ